MSGFRCGCDSRRGRGLFVGFGCGCRRVRVGVLVAFCGAVGV